MWKRQSSSTWHTNLHCGKPSSLHNDLDAIQSIFIGKLLFFKNGQHRERETAEAPICQIYSSPNSTHQTALPSPEESLSFCRIPVRDCRATPLFCGGICFKI